MSSTAPEHVTLRIVGGPPLPDGRAHLTCDPALGSVLGRGSESELLLPDPGVSRRHAMLCVDEATGRPAVRDLGSRHGTFLNGNRVAQERPEPIADADQLRVGPWTFRIECELERRTPTSVSLSEETRAGGGRVQRVPVNELGRMAQHRLDLLIDCAGRVNAASDEAVMAAAALESALAGTGYARAAMVRGPDDDGLVQLIGYRSQVGDNPDNLRLSRSLIQAAAEGETVRLTADSSPTSANYGQSIVQYSIHSALCAPVLIGSSIEAYLYLDARGSEDAVQHDAAAFVQAVARISGLAIANIRRGRLEREQALLTAELSAAREAQELIMPDLEGDLGWLRYALETRPGRHVAGDLFDIVPLGDEPDAPVACFLGDVAGKGVGAAITMATVQTYLRVALKANPDPATVVRAVNRHIADRLPGGRFVSLWLGVLDPKARQITFVDAGHGHWLVRHAGGEPARIKCRGGLPLGLAPDAAYENETTGFEPGSRLLVYSDGVVEQPVFGGTSADEMFGLKRTLDALRQSTSAAGDVRALDEAVLAFAGTDLLADDFTVASCEWVAGDTGA